MFAGRPADLVADGASLTGQYLSGRKRIEIPAKRRRGSGKALSLYGASANNLKQVDVRFPLGCLTCVTGVSGSGKSTLVLETLYRLLAQHLHRSRVPAGGHARIEGLSHVDKVVNIDQSPIGKTPRSNPGTYTGIFTFIRRAFRPHPRGPHARLQTRTVQLQRQGRPLRGVQRRRHRQDRNAVPAGCLRGLRCLQGQTVQPGNTGGPLQGAHDRRGARHDRQPGAPVSARHRHAARAPADLD